MSIKILAGEGLRLGKHNGTNISFGILYLKRDKGLLAKRKYSLTQVKEIQTIDEENYRTLGATAGWGLVGVAVAGPFGAALGGYFGGKKNTITAAVAMDDGFRFLAEFKPGSFRKLAKHNRKKSILERAGIGGDDCQ